MTTITLRDGLESEWASANPVLAKSELGIESDTNRFKIGDGTSNWADMPYFIDEDFIASLIAAAGGGGGGGIFVGDADDIPDGTTKVIMTAVERAKLSGIATGATANQSDSFLLDRANHTGDILLAEIPEITAEASLLLQAGDSTAMRDVTQSFGPTVDPAQVMVVQYFTTADEPRVYGARTDVSTVWRGPVEPDNILVGDSWEILG